MCLGSRNKICFFFEDMTKGRTLLKDERLSQKVERDMTNSKFASLCWCRDLNHGYLSEAEIETTVPTDHTFKKLKTIQNLDRRNLRFHLVPVRRSTIKNCFVDESRRRFVVSAS